MFKRYKNIKIDGMLLSTFLSTLFYSMSYPYIHKTIISGLPNEFISMNQIVNCSAIVLFGTLWNKKSDNLFRYYPVLCIIETIAEIISAIYITTTHNIIAYYIIDTLIFATICRNMSCGYVKLKALRYNSEKDREVFDNNNNSVFAIATIIGSALAMTIDLKFNYMFWLAALGNAVDNILYMFIYFNTRKRKNN